MDCSPNDPRHWLDRAEEARLLSEKMTNLIAREHMLAAAAAYDLVARLAEIGPIFRIPPRPAKSE